MMEKEESQLSSEQLLQKLGFQPMVTAIRQSMAVVDEAMRGQRDIFPTRWPRLNRQLLGGLQPKKLYVVAGRPGSGKSAFSNQLVFDVLDLARIAGKRVVVFYWSFEMPGYQQILRYAAKDTGKSLSDLYSVDAPLSKASFDAYAKSVTSYARFPIFFQNRPRSIAYIEDATARHLALNPDFYLINLIDHSRLLEEDKVDEEMKKLNLLSKGCMRMQAEHDKCLTILLSQLNRNIEQPERAKAQYQPLLTDLFGGDSIGQDAHAVMMLQRPHDMYGITSTYCGEDPKKLMAVHLEKNRDGIMGMVPFDFDGARFSITERPRR